MSILDFKGNRGDLMGSLAPLRACWDLSGSILVAFWVQLGIHLGSFGAIDGVWDPLEGLMVVLGVSWGASGDLLGPNVDETWTKCC